MAAQGKKSYTTSKRTSQGRKHAPLNKYKKAPWKRYRGQGSPK